MTFKERINDSVVWWSLGLLVLGFTAGYGAYAQIVSITGSESVKKGSYLTKEQVEKDYIGSDVVASQYFPRTCARMANYPLGVWNMVRTKAPTANQDNAVIPEPITLTDAAHGTWFEGLGKSKKGKYPKIVVGPLTIAPAISAGAHVQLTMMHGDLNNEPLATPVDREFTATATLFVSEDGCAMSGSFTSRPASGTVVYCWEVGQFKGLCPGHR
ncbi:MAG: hypothetical protein WA020_06095 [Candidatus Acidiferrales bacterium]